MPSYKPPLKDINFILNDVLKAAERTKDIPAYAGSDNEMSAMLLNAVADFATKVSFPLNKSADAEGCTYNPADGSVKTPTGFKDAYDKFCELGIIGLTGSETYGGVGQPHYLSAAVNEILTAANFSLSTYGGLTGGAAKVLEHFATDEIKNLYLPKMYTGEWTGTMCLTEPDAGTDLAAVSTKAIPQADGSVKITGNKIFITSGEHDMADNICHLVLARLPGAPAGTKGISLFLVPKKAVNDAGQSTGGNGVLCTGIEHKMGINGSATCALAFEDSTGYLIGKEGEGLKAMFTMMNDARLKVGIQGLSLSEAAYQNAAIYSTVRVQGTSMKDAFNGNAKPVTIINHANVRKDLIDMKSQIEGFRALAYETAIYLDIAEKHPDAATRQKAEIYTSLLTPVVKSCLTDLSCTVAQKGIQLHGGMGFITETGVEQYYRDSLIGTIYEGTNDVQSMDFTFRKAFANNGASLVALSNTMKAELMTAAANPALQGYAAVVGEGLKSFGATVASLGQQLAAGKVDDVLTHSRDFMDMFGKLAVGQMWLRIMTTAIEKSASNPQDKDFYDTRILLGDNFIKRIMLPEIKKLESRIAAGAYPIRKLGEGNLIP